MYWEAISTIAEMIAALGVIASLIYLAVQIRQNTKVSRAETTKDLYLASRAAILEIAANDALAEIWTDIRDFESKEIGRRYAFYQSFFRLYELQHNLAKQDLLDPEIATSYALIIRMFVGTKYFNDYWSVAQLEFNPTFVSFVEEQIEVVRPTGNRSGDEL